ncbi:MAG: response regulator transcription factor [Alphaproteobacteria bacterium]|nr:response regulator transcription factor [Alphaproteobacteria bacterium]
MSTTASDVTRRRILLVDDDPALRETLAEQLGFHEEYAIGQAENGAQAIEAIDADHFDAIVLDVGLPDMDGRDLCKLMRRRGVKAPIIMLTGQDSDADAILGLDAGANDYITKPFRFNVFMARIRAQLRTHEQSDDAVFNVGPYAFLPAAKMLTNSETDRKVRLTEKETAILKFLYRAGGKVVSRDTLLDEVWGYNAGVNTHTLETHVYRLRQKIEPDPQQNVILITEPGGYKLGV